MELRHLRYFLAVAEELHFARAAQRVGISQPPLSQQIGALEQELGVRLFDRTSRTVRLTSAGKAFLEPARATLAQADRATQVARRASRGELGELAVGFNASAPFIPKVANAIVEFRNRYPDIRLALTEVHGTAQPALLDDHSLDVVFVRNVDRMALSPRITATLLLEERLFVAMRPEHPLARRNEVGLRDLAGEPMVLYSREGGSCFTDQLLELLDHAGVEPLIAQTVREVSTLFGLAAAGVGVTVLAESLCALQSARLAYRPLADPAAITTMWLLHLPEHSLTLQCRNFLDIIRRDGSPLESQRSDDRAGRAEIA